MIGMHTDIGDHKKIEKALRRRSRELALLNRLGRELTATLDLQQATERLMQATIEIIGVEGASVWLWDEKQKGWLACQAITHSKEHSLADLRLRSGQGVAGWVAQNEESVIVPYAPDDPRFFPGIDAQTGFRTISLLAVPLRVRGKVIGTLEVMNKQDGNFDKDDLALVETLAASAAIAIDNAKLVEALRQHVEELEARNEDLDAFAHSVAHDLKSPLTKVIGFVEVLEEDYATIPEEEARLCLNKIMQSGHKMSNIIDELLLLASLRKMEEAELELLDMAEIVAAAQRRLAHLIRKHQAEISMSPEGAWPVAQGYGPWVEEVWVNYLSNAIRYGGRPPRVELGAMVQTDGTIRFWVRDNGPGLTSEEQARLFTPFERLDQARTKGHGLGLSIVRRIVAKLGGQVGVESQVGRGSVFYFTLQGE
jgi:signal transduction histidine kinase